MSFDTETTLIRHGQVPRLVCGSAGWLVPGPRIEGALLDKDVAREVFVQALEDPSAVLGGANIAFDLAVMAVDLGKLGIDAYPHIFAMLDPGARGGCEDGRVYDLQLAEALGAIAEGTLGKDPRTTGPLKNPETGKPGSYSLSMCVDLVLGRQDAKVNDTWRLRYGELDEIPIEQWPAEARDYPVDDARNTHEVILAQTGHLPRVSTQHDWENVVFPDGRQALVCKDCKSSRISAMCTPTRAQKNLHEVSRQVASAFCLHLEDTQGLSVDQRKVDLIEKYYTLKRADAVDPFVEAGIIREDGSENQAKIKRLIALAYGATEDCPYCRGTGEIPHPDQPTLRCPDCKGRCQPWKGGGKINAPTVASCETCKSTGRVAHHNVKMTKCVGPEGEKSCCGTGLVLVEGLPRTETDDISIGKDALHQSGNEFLMSLGDFKEDQKVLNVYVPFLRKARTCAFCDRWGDDDEPHLETCVTQMGILVAWIDGRLRLRSNVILENGRVSYRGLIQTFPRWKGFIDKCFVGTEENPIYIPSLRECFVGTAPKYEIVEVPDDYVLQPGEEKVVA